MRLTNEVVVPAESETVFRLLSDVERVAPCLPGATLEGSVGPDSYKGRVKVKVGPIAAAYQGTVRLMEVDGNANRILLDARGADQHGSGNAEARVDVRVRPHARGCALTLDTDLVIRGKVAQFGRGAIADVSQKLMEQFARNVESLLTAPASSAGAEPATSQVAERAAGEEAAVDGWSLVAIPLLKRAGPVVGILAAVAAILLMSRRRPTSVISDQVLPGVLHIDGQKLSVSLRRRIELC